MEKNIEINVITEAIKQYLKPIVTEVITESLTEAFYEMEKRRNKRYYTREELCNLLRIGTTTFYRLAKMGKITILKIQGKTLVNADEIDNLIETKQVYRYKHY